MNDNQSIFLLEVKPFFTEQSGKILSELLGIETKVLIFGEDKPITEETLRQVYTLPVVFITINCPNLGGDLIVCMEQSSLIHFLNYHIDGPFLTDDDEERIQNEATQFLYDYMDKLIKEFSEKTGRDAKISPSIQFEYFHDQETRDDFSLHTRIDMNVIVEDDFVGHLIILLSPEVVATYLENRKSFSQCFRQSYDKKADQSAEVPFVGAPVYSFRNQGNIEMLLNLELPIVIELGRAKMMVKDIFELGPGKVIELKKYSSDPVDIYLDHKKFAEGEVIFNDHCFSVRITALVGPDERLSHLSKEINHK